MSATDAARAKSAATSGKAYASKSDAEVKYKEQLAKKTVYTTPMPPKARPEYVPEDVVVGSRPAKVVYHAYPNGGYGYGYYDPATNVFVALAASQMVLNAQRQAELDRMYAEQRYADQYAASQAPAVVVAATAPAQVPAQDTGHGFFFYAFIICLMAGALVLLVLFLRSSST